MMSRPLRARQALVSELDKLDACPRCVVDADACHAKKWERVLGEARAAVRAALKEAAKKPN